MSLYCIMMQYKQLSSICNQYLAQYLLSYRVWNLMKHCFDYALNYIYRYPKTERELRIQLSKKWYFGSEIDDTIHLLREKWYIDDRNFASMYIESELIHKGKPTSIIMKKLLEKGVDKLLIKELMDSYEIQANESIGVRIKKELERLKKLWNEGVDSIQKLMRRWYTLKQIKEVLREHK